jgi:hypothetical protein
LSGIKFFTADAYLQEGWTAFAHRASGLLPAHSTAGLRDVFICRMVETVIPGDIVAVDLPRYYESDPDTSGGTGRNATPEEEARLIAEGSAERRD